MSSTPATTNKPGAARGTPVTASAAARRGSKPKGTRTPRGEGPAAQPRKAQGADDKAHEAEFRGLCHVHDVVELQVGTDSLPSSNDMRTRC